MMILVDLTNDLYADTNWSKEFRKVGVGMDWIFNDPIQIHFRSK